MDQTPTVDNNQVYFPSYDKSIYCVDKKNGELKWKKSINSIVTHIGLKDSLIVFNTMDGTLFVMNKTNGEKLWEFNSEGKTYSRAIMAEYIVYFGSGNGNVYAFDLFTGKQIWKFEAGIGIDRMTIDNGIIFFGSGNDMYAIE
jgi:outer membrane protein assembly factor BamB